MISQNPYLYGGLTVLLTLSLIRLGSGTFNPLKIAEGADKRLSTSKLQMLLWTLVTLFAYVTIFVARAFKGDGFAALPDIPTNVMIVLGMSIGTTTLSKAITVGYVQSGRVTKTVDETNSAGLGALVNDDSGSVDLTKVQMLAWTLISICVYLATVFMTVNKGVFLPDSYAIPNIDGALMVLMGLGQGAFLGKKLTLSTISRISGLAPSTAAPKTEVMITGLCFGESSAGNAVTLDGQPITSTNVISWSDTAIRFTVPDVPPVGAAWNATGQITEVRVLSGGQTSANGMPLTINPSQQVALPPGPALNLGNLGGPQQPIKPEPSLLNFG